MVRFGWLAGLALFASAGVATAGDVYSQPGSQACDPSCWTSQYASGSGYRAYDDFTLSTAATITSVTWQGIYIPETTTASAPAPDTTTWSLGFFADSGDFPAGSLYSASLPAASVTTTYLGAGTFGAQPVNLYSFTATLPTSFSAAAGVKYWFSPLSQATTFDPFFSWSASTSVYDGLTAQTETNGANFDRSDDRAFSLSTSVPEPATWAMMIGGLGLVGIGARRRRTVVAI